MQTYIVCKRLNETSIYCCHAGACMKCSWEAWTHFLCTWLCSSSYIYIPTISKVSYNLSHLFFLRCCLGLWKYAYLKNASSWSVYWSGSRICSIYLWPTDWTGLWDSWNPYAQLQPLNDVGPHLHANLHFRFRCLQLNSHGLCLEVLTSHIYLCTVCCGGELVLQIAKLLWSHCNLEVMVDKMVWNIDGLSHTCT